jgi:hypothetical protein
MTDGNPHMRSVSDLGLSLPLRIWIGIEVLFGLMSIVTISLSPGNTDANFSWPVKPEVTAALLGGFYFAAASFYVLALFARRWENIRVFIIASILFSSTELLATFLHWDRFSIGTTPFNVWFVSYILPPPLFIAFYIWHQRRAAPIPKAGDEPLPSGLRSLLRILGVPVALVAVVAFVMPAIIIPLMPWQFTPLTLRALSGWVLALGAMMISAAHENDRTRCRIISPFFILLLPAIAIEVLRYPDQVNRSHPTVYVALALLAATFVLGLYLARGDWRRTMR